MIRLSKISSVKNRVAGCITLLILCFSVAAQSPVDVCKQPAPESRFEEYTTRINTDPNDFRAYVYRANELFYRMKKAREAFSDLNKALQIEPRSPLILTERGKLFSLMGRYKEAVEDFTAALENDG
jgi:tetratricopeptide (TPR) repeat protein